MLGLNAMRTKLVLHALGRWPPEARLYCLGQAWLFKSSILSCELVELIVSNAENDYDATGLLVVICNGQCGLNMQWIVPARIAPKPQASHEPGVATQMK